MQLVSENPLNSQFSPIFDENSDILLPRLPEVESNTDPDFLSKNSTSENTKKSRSKLADSAKFPKDTKFKCVSKVLSLEIRKELNRGLNKGKRVVKATVGNFKAPNLEDSYFHNLEDFKLMGNTYRYETKSQSLAQKFENKRSNSFDSFKKFRSGSNTSLLDRSLPAKLHSQYKSSFNQLLSNRNKYDVSFSEFGKSMSKLDSSSKCRKENLFPKSGISIDSVALTTDTQYDLEDSEVKVMTEVICMTFLRMNQYLL